MERDLLSDCTEVCTALTQFVESTEDDTLPQYDESILMLDGLTRAAQGIRDLQQAIRVEMHTRLKDAGADRMTLNDGRLLEPAGAYRYTEVDRDGLTSFVFRQIDDNRVDPDTGEIIDIGTQLLGLFLKCFRQEPRWTPLKELGLDPDEYARRKFQPSIKVTGG